VEFDDELFLVVAADARHLRSVRLVVADAGRRAGLSVSEIDDLRIAVDELTQALIEVTEHRIAIRVVVRGAQVVVRGSARRRASDPAPSLRGVPALIVDAVSDHHELTHGKTEMEFVLAKTAAADSEEGEVVR
jgi:hypothetical protein